MTALHCLTTLKPMNTISNQLRRLETRLMEHRDACKRGMEKSAVAEHAWEHHHLIHWEEITVLDHGR